jgi:hypothetical protein
MKIKLILVFVLVWGDGLFASEPDTNSLLQAGVHNWEYIQYPWNFSHGPTFVIGWPSGGNERSDEMSRGLRMDILNITQGVAFFKTNAISARLYRANGQIVEPTVEGKELLNEPVSTSWAGSLPNGEFAPQVVTYFPWGTNTLEEAWIEVTISSNRYWVEIPYGFDRKPAGPLAPSNTNGPPRFVPAMKSLTEHGHVVRWESVHYDLGEIQNGWRLFLIQSNSDEAESQVVLYPEHVKIGTATSWNAAAWKTNSPATALRVLDATGTIIGSHRIDVDLSYNGMGYAYDLARNGDDQRCWGRIEISVGDKTYGVVVPSSLYKYAHGHAWQQTSKINSATNTSCAQLVGEFKNSTVFWQQFEMASNIVALGDTNVLPGLASWLTNEDRHVRGNAAFIFAGLGDNRGFEVLRNILNDRSERPKEQGVPGGNWTLQAQIATDRYYATHLFGDLKDPRAVPILVPLLRDKEVNYIVPWALGEIGDKRAIEPLIGVLSDSDASMRVLAIYSLEKLDAREALPRLRALLNDNDRSDFDKCISVAEAAKTAISRLQR